MLRQVRNKCSNGAKCPRVDSNETVRHCEKGLLHDYDDSSARRGIAFPPLVPPVAESYRRRASHFSQIRKTSKQANLGIKPSLSNVAITPR